jgi:hypothetical protein
MAGIKMGLQKPGGPQKSFASGIIENQNQKGSD